MERMFGKMMESCMKGMSEEDRKRMMEKMAVMCPCAGKELSEEDVKAIREKMMAFCGSKMEMLSACFGKSCSTVDQTCCGITLECYVSMGPVVKAGPYLKGCMNYLEWKNKTRSASYRTVNVYPPGCES